MSLLCSLELLRLSHGLDAHALHVGAHLIRNLFEHLLVEVAAGHACVELNELDDIASGRDAASIPETAVVAIQLLHGAEVCVAYAHDNDGAWELGQLTDQLNGLGHVMDSAISQEEQDLVAVLSRHRLHVSLELSEKWSEERRSTKTNLWQCLSVGLHDGLDADNLWIARIAVHCEAMVRRIQVQMARDASKAEDWEASVRIVWLNDHAHVEKGRLILVVLAEVMERVWTCWVAIRLSVVDGCNERDAPT